MKLKRTLATIFGGFLAEIGGYYAGSLCFGLGESGEVVEMSDGSRSVFEIRGVFASGIELRGKPCFHI